MNSYFGRKWDRILRWAHNKYRHIHCLDEYDARPEWLYVIFDEATHEILCHGTDMGKAPHTITRSFLEHDVRKYPGSLGITWSWPFTYETKELKKPIIWIIRERDLHKEAEAAP